MTAAPLSSRCEVCGAGVGVECAEVVPGQLADRRFHFGRTDDTAVQFVPRDSSRPYDPPALTASSTNRK